MRRPSEFEAAFAGARSRQGRVAVFLSVAGAKDVADLPPAKVGFVVPKRIGNSPQRHRLTRQMRHIVRPWLADGTLRPGESLVVSALPGCAGITSAALAADMQAGLERARSKVVA